MYWIILERQEKEFHEDGIRFKAFPCIEDTDEGVKETLEIVREDNQKYWIVKEGK